MLYCMQSFNIKMCSKMSVLVIFLSVVMFTLADWQTCTPCKCKIYIVFSITIETVVKSEVKYANCSTSATNLITLREVPHHLDSQIEHLSLEEQPLKHIPQDAFSSVHLVNLKIINLNHCNITSVHANAFRGIHNLTTLSMSYNEIVTLDTGIFQHNLKLTTLSLRSNKLTVIPAELFADLTLLETLDISRNNIYYIDKFALITNMNLRVFRFEFNALTHMDAFIFKNLNNLALAAPSGNPWSCDCRLKSLKRAIRFLFPEPTCMEPENLRGTDWHMLKSNTLSCWLHIISQQNVTNITVHDDTVVLSCMVEAFPEPHITWMHSNKALDLDNATQKYQLSRSHWNHTMYYYNLTIFNVTSADKGLYTCKLNNVEKEMETRFNLTIKPAKLPVILAPTASTITADVETNNFTLACKVISIPRPNIKWVYRAVDTDIEQTNMINSVGIESDSYWSNLTISQLTPKYNGKYWCMASNSKGQVTKEIVLNARSYLSNWLIFFMILGSGFIVILTLLFILKCFSQLYITSNETKDTFKS